MTNPGKRTYFNWSSGKDSALALYKMLKQGDYHVESLVTTVNRDFGRVSMHGLPENLLDRQAESIGLPLRKVYFPSVVDMETYNRTMKEETAKLYGEGYRYATFGDIFLEDLKKYREGKLAEVGIKTVFPLWKQDTRTLMEEFLRLGFRAITVCVNARLLGKEFCGREVDECFIRDLPEQVDVCGENGEFHTFVYDGPIFRQPVAFETGEKVLKNYASQDDAKQQNWDNSFWYCDLSPGSGLP
ncbi:diphthine--ammonia ligase [Sinomicrobium weinanense]|uniref:Diphthine--ammonia ligase n=1 Tax=Sinomicrobium weinanense TaxID=2842200 RepID=A0A926JRM2_9FLAO|nr:diphthine--ammonia ligase [Sinomicrobium weinanense]MBC9796168.1 diphthine--ammonia ligase [Sinomicrobium weinanense]MBU3123447.1 diphthine--ammonia ligase [Sinomicrobium weinanense]